MEIMNYAEWAAYAAIYFFFATVLSHVLNIRSKGSFDAAEAIAGGNTAIGFRRAGAQIGLAVAMLGVLLGGSHPDFATDVVQSLVYGALAIVFMLTSLAVIDKVVLPKVDNNTAVGSGNTAVGIVEFGTLVMTGIIGFASIYGDNGGILSSLAYFALGQVAVVAVVLLFEAVTKHNVVESIANGKVASGVYLSGKIIAYGLIMMSAIKGNGAATEVTNALLEFGVAALIGMVFLYVAEYLIDLVIITKTSVGEMLAEDNVAAMLQLSGVKVGMALILGFAVL